MPFVELKAITKPAKDAYYDNLRDYKTTIPQLFWHNAVVILSNGHELRIGTITSEWEHFAEWRRAVSLGLTEEELALFDILAILAILAILKKGKLVLDWRKKQQTKAAVRTTIARTLRRDLATLYPAHLLTDKNDLIYQHIYDAYPSRIDNIYTHLTY